MEIKDILLHQRIAVKNILQHQFDDKDSIRAIDLFFENVKTQDKEFIKKLKQRLHYIFSGGHSNTADICEDEIDKLSGYALSEDSEVEG